MFPLEAKCLPHYTTTYNFILFFLSLLGTMRPEDNSLDLNNLPDEYGKQVLQDSSSSGYRKNESGLKDAKEECGKVYECRFCSLKFCKSQALGGHMNRHRQERETETLNHARQLVYRNDHTNLPTGCCEAIVSSGGRYHSAATNMGEGTVRMRFPRYISTSSPIQITAPQLQHLSQPSQNIFYASPSRSLCFPSANEYSCIGAPVFGGSLHNQDGF